MPRGARQRGRTADGRARARKGTQRVLKSGTHEEYSRKGTQKGVLKKGYSKRYSKGYSNAVLKSDAQKAVLKKGYSKGGTRLGYSRNVLTNIQRSGETAPGSCGRVCGVLAGSARQCGAHQSRVCAARHCRVLTGYSQGTHRVLRNAGSGSDGPLCTAASFVGQRHAVQRMCAAPRRGLLGG